MLASKRSSGIQVWNFSACVFIKNKTPAQVFFCEFCKIVWKFTLQNICERLLKIWSIRDSFVRFIVHCSKRITYVSFCIYVSSESKDQVYFSTILNCIDVNPAFFSFFFFWKILFFEKSKNLLHTHKLSLI